LIDWLDRHVGFAAVAGVGHRVVHGGLKLSEAQRITTQLVAELHRISPYDPEHMPSGIQLMEVFHQHHPQLPQVACFDTAFHRDMPRVAKLLAIPRRFDVKGVQRFGFHGLSYAFLMEELARVAGPQAARGRLILAHLGNGASLAAVRNGKSIDTSMGFTPASGIPMSTRSGDLDPGLVWYLARTENMTGKQFHEMVHHQSGLLGVSEISPDMRDLLAREAKDVRAAEAVALFCYQVKKWIGGFAAALGGLDTLVFTGGIGENAFPVRARICEGLEFLGIRLDARKNETSAPVISTRASRVTVRVIRTDEEVTIARTVCRVLGLSTNPAAPDKTKGRKGKWQIFGIQRTKERKHEQASLPRTARKDERLLARGQLPVCRPNLSLRQPSPQAAAETGARETPVAWPLGHHARVELPLRPLEPRHQEV
jgi:acetate kinase